jgi:hypothetical protein
MIRNGQFVLHRCNFDRFFNRLQAAGIDRTRQRLFLQRSPSCRGIFGCHSPHRTQQKALKFIEATGSTSPIASSMHSPKVAFYKRAAFCCKLSNQRLSLLSSAFSNGNLHAFDFQMATNVELPMLRCNGPIRSSPSRTRYAGTAGRNHALVGNPDSCVRHPLRNTRDSHRPSLCLFFEK